MSTSRVSELTVCSHAPQSLHQGMVVYEVPLRNVSVRRITRTWHLTSIDYFHDACRLAIRDLAVPTEIRIICVTGRAEGNLDRKPIAKKNIVQETTIVFQKKVVTEAYCFRRGRRAETSRLGSDVNSAIILFLTALQRREKQEPIDYRVCTHKGTPFPFSDIADRADYKIEHG